MLIEWVLIGRLEWFTKIQIILFLKHWNICSHFQISLVTEVVQCHSHLKYSGFCEVENMTPLLWWVCLMISVTSIIMCISETQKKKGWQWSNTNIERTWVSFGENNLTFHTACWEDPLENSKKLELVFWFQSQGYFQCF